MKKLWMSMIVATMAVAVAHANVFIVSNPDKEGGAVANMKTFLEYNFTAAELGTITTSAYESGAPAAGAGDLVIIMRSLTNSAYDDSDAEIESWGNLAAGILCISPYLPDNDRLGWSGTGAQGYETSPTGAETLMTADSLFTGVTDVGGYADLIVDATYYRAHAASAYTAGQQVGTTDGGKIVLARIAAGEEYNSSKDSTTPDFHGGDRIVFHYSTEPAIIANNLTMDGMQVLRNSIAELSGDLEYANVIPEPATVGMLGMGALITLLIRRRLR